MIRRAAGFAGILVVALATALVPGCAGKKKSKATSEFLPAPELVALAEAELADRDFQKARTYLERVTYSPADRTELEPKVRLLLADVAFWQGDDLSMIEARAKYQDFASLYPTHPRAAYAQFQAGIASFKQVRDPTRDQAQTKIAIADLREVLKRFPDSPYARAARLRLEEAEGFLAEHEYDVALFYLKKKKYKAAEDRLRGLLDAYPRYAARDKVYVGLGRALLGTGNTAEGKAFLDKVLEDWPGGKWAEEARETLDDFAKRAEKPA